jgi:hypothetical protein
VSTREDIGTASSGSGGSTTVKAVGTFKDLSWGAKSLKPGAKITLSADISSWPAPPAQVTFEIRSIRGAGDPIATVNAKIEGKKANGEWTSPDEGLPPRIVFVAKAGDQTAVSPVIPVASGQMEKASWAPPSAKPGDKVQVKVKLSGFAPGVSVAVKIFEDDVAHEDHAVADLSGTTNATGEIAIDWTVPTTHQDASVPRHLPMNPQGHGDGADDTYAVQRLLAALFEKKKLDVDPGAANGALHDRTLLAIVAFKKAKSLAPADGTINEAFRTALVDEYRTSVGKDLPAEPQPFDDMPDYHFNVTVKGQAFHGPQLKVVPPYRLCLEVGDAGLFGAPIVSSAADEAKRKSAELLALKQRVQAIGYHYEPLKKGEFAGDPMTETPRWKIARAALERDGKDLGRAFDDDAKTRDTVLDVLQKKLVVLETCKHRMLEDCSCPKLDGTRPIITGKDCQIRFPGALTFRSDTELDWPDMKKPNYRFAADQAFFAANDLLGMVPIVARVQEKIRKKSGGKDSFRDAEDGVAVIFELIPPFRDENATQDLARLGDGDGNLGLVEDGFGHKAKHGPRKYVSERAREDFDKTDPQRINVLKKWGGKRSTPAVPNLFAMGDLGMGERWPWRAEAVDGRPNAVRVRTGPDGCAVACLRPFRAGGEVLKLRVWVEDACAPADTDDPPAPGDDGWTKENQPAGTGNLTVWRTVMIDRILRKPIRKDDKADTKYAGTKLPTIDLDKLAREWRKAFLQPEFSTRAKKGEDLTDDMYATAHGEAVKTVKEGIKKYKFPDYDYDKLLSNESSSKPYLITLADLTNYNASVAKAKQFLITPASWRTWGPIANVYQSGFMKSLTGDGEPGLTLVYSLAGDELSYSKRFPRSFLLSTAYPVKMEGLLSKALGVEHLKGATFHANVTHSDGKKTTLTKEDFTDDATLGDYFNWIFPGGFSEADGRADAQFDEDKNKLVMSFTAKETPTVVIEVKEEGADAFTEVDSMRTRRLPRDWIPATTSGTATRYRGAFLYFGEEFYADYHYDASSNTLHELGHVLYMKHHWLDSSNDPGHDAVDHDYGDMCVMSYRNCDGDYCGRCLLHLRGWNINAIPLNNAEFQS